MPATVPVPADKLTALCDALGVGFPDFTSPRGVSDTLDQLIEAVEGSTNGGNVLEDEELASMDRADRMPPVYMSETASRAALPTRAQRARYVDQVADEFFRTLSGNRGDIYLRKRGRR
jgi:hypothetical protein